MKWIDINDFLIGLFIPGPIAQAVVSLTADPGIVTLFQARSHTFMEIDRETISMVILLL